MLKGAIIFFAFSIFLFGCATKMAHRPLSLPPPSPPVAPPDHTISEIPLSEAPLSEAPLSEREVEKIETPEVSPDVDKKEALAEEKESSDKLTEDLHEEVALLTPPPVPPRLEVPEAPSLLPVLIITDLFLNPKKSLAVTVANIGNGPLPMGLGNLKIFIDGQFKRSYSLSSLSDQSFLQPKEDITVTTSFIIRGRREVRAYVETAPEIGELNEEKNHIEKILEGLPFGPDITIEDLDLTEDFDLFIILSNAGEVDLRKGATFRIRIVVNGLKISEFDHLISEGLKANFGNRYTLDPPYRVGIGGTAKVKVSVWPRVSSDDTYSGNNALERTFNIFPFRMLPQEKQEFSFTVSPPRLKDDGQTEKIKAEVRWEGEGASLLLTFTGPEPIHFRPISDRSLQKVEFPIHFGEVESESLWKVSVANLIEKKVEGYLIIQHP
jgi:hypothetical protein